MKIKAKVKINGKVYDSEIIYSSPSAIEDLKNHKWNGRQRVRTASIMHPIDTFDAFHALGYRLNLIDGFWYR